MQIKITRFLAGILCLVIPMAFVQGQELKSNKRFSRADTLRGSLSAERNWWNVLRYDLEITPDYTSKSIAGRNNIKFSSVDGGERMQLDLQEPMQLDSVIYENQHLPFEREGNVYWISFEGLRKATIGNNFLTVYFHGQPVAAKRPPWEGGWIWATDQKGRPWMSVACQGIGASVWYPCKDHQSDEPEEGASLTMVVPDTLVAVGNGRLISRIDLKNHSVYRWEIRNPINNYNIIPYIGHYKQFGETFDGEDGKLTCNYWVLDYDLEKAKNQFKQVKPMLQCFEHWFGPYPFYEDGYQLIQAPHLGMEHQSGIAYGNGFVNGYRGRDLSGSGWGNLWDFIIVHESGHEWFGNNITSKDIADMWIHESFTNYSETIFTQCQSGLLASRQYVQGIRKNIANDRPIIGSYNVNEEGSGDMYYKGANMIHTIRTIMQNDSLFRSILRGLNKDFYHQTVTTQQVEQYINKRAGKNFDKVFDQYLRDTRIPLLSWKISKGKLSARFSRCLPGFEMPVFLPASAQEGRWLTVNDKDWTTIVSSLTEAEAETLWNKNLYIEYQAVAPY